MTSRRRGPYPLALAAFAGGLMVSAVIAAREMTVALRERERELRARRAPPPGHGAGGPGPPGAGAGQSALERGQVLAPRCHRHRGQRVRAARTGREGLRLAAAQPPRLLVLDIGLPDRDGFGVVRALRADPGLRGLPLPVYTNWDLNAGQRDRLTPGPTRFLVESRGSADDFEAAVAEMLAAAGASS